MSKNNPTIFITNINEAYTYSPNFDSVLTAGPEAREVADFRHPDHLVVEFDDVVQGWPGVPEWQEPTEEHVRTILDWASTRKGRSLLVHCHAGMSRSTASAIGILASWGYSQREAWDLVKLNRPIKSREFFPNPLILSHIDRLLGTNFVALAEQEEMLSGEYETLAWID